MAYVEGFCHKTMIRRVMKKYNISEKDMKNMLDILGALKDKTRLKIVFELMSGKKCVGDIVEGVGMTQSAVSHQLIFLKNTNLVSSTKEGNKVYYMISDEHVKKVVDMCLVHAREIADE